MLEFNEKTGAMTWKIVYYGPALSGKTTNLLTLHDLIPESKRGLMMQAETKQDRTLFFDLMPLAFRTRTGARLKIKLFTVPGRAQNDLTEKFMLTGADGVVFVADSQKTCTLHNAESFAELEENIYRVGKSFETLPLVIQFNKRDLRPENIQSEQAVLSRWERPALSVYFSSAIYGIGVRATFNAIISEVCQSLQKQHDLLERFGISPDEIISNLNREQANNSVKEIENAAGIGFSH